MQHSNFLCEKNPLLWLLIQIWVERNERKLFLLPSLWLKITCTFYIKYDHNRTNFYSKTAKCIINYYFHFMDFLSLSCLLKNNFCTKRINWWKMWLIYLQQSSSYCDFFSNATLKHIKTKYRIVPGPLFPTQIFKWFYPVEIKFCPSLLNFLRPKVWVFSMIHRLWILQIIYPRGSNWIFFLPKL